MTRSVLPDEDLERVRAPLIGVLARAEIPMYEGEARDERLVARWAAAAARAVLAVSVFTPEEQIRRVLAKVKALPELQAAVAAGASVGASSMDLFWMMEEWGT